MKNMKLLINKDEKEILTKIYENGNEEEFDYIRLINAIYRGEEIELDVQNFSEEEKNKFIELFDEIKKVAAKQKEDTESAV